LPELQFKSEGFLLQPIVITAQNRSNQTYSLYNRLQREAQKERESR